MVATLGLIGVGRMGTGMGRRLVSKGRELSLYDLASETCEVLAGETGAAVEKDPAAVARAAEVVVLSLPRSSDVEAVVEGAGGLLEASRPGLVVVDTTSGDPATSRRLAGVLADADADYLDTGVSGGVAGAEAGTLKIMVGGARRAFERVRPVLELLGTRVWYCGAAGSGHAMKTVLNLAAQTKLMAEIESLALGVRSGLDPVQVAEVLDLEVCQHFLLGPGGRIPFEFALALVEKDFDVAMKLASELGVSTPVCEAAVQAMSAIRAEVGGEADLMDFVGVVERRNDVRLDRGGGAGEDAG